MRPPGEWRTLSPFFSSFCCQAQVRASTKKLSSKSLPQVWHDHFINHFNMNILSLLAIGVILLVPDVHGAVKRCFKCRSRGELGDCRNPDDRTSSLSSTGRNPFLSSADRDQTTRSNSNAFGSNFESSGSWGGVEAVPCSSGWCAKVIEGKGTFKAEEYGMATERMCLQRPPQDLRERCAMTVRGNQEVFMCFCKGDLCNGQPSFAAPLHLIAGLALSTLFIWRAV
ncbi:uncharacterized protein LOC124209941 [Daphnia pulex]|uniref:uncharacterized protein LOC124209941 n=1 Tax=Daphnia pulex TaxID=6669 RepID=UPI001EDEA64A|nr:uncharacterized protein LOC124209941 [Daphnia pulex]